MSSTRNYNLHLTDNADEKFYDWRQAMNGTQDSNMIKIDTALGEKADKVVYDPDNAVADAGGIAAYVQEAAPPGKTTFKFWPAVNGGA